MRTYGNCQINFVWIVKDRHLIDFFLQHLSLDKSAWILIFCTGALHEDGLADVADGFGAGGTRDRILSIMRDSRIGSYGTIALVLSLLGASLLGIA